MVTAKVAGRRAARREGFKSLLVEFESVGYFVSRLTRRRWGPSSHRAMVGSVVCSAVRLRLRGLSCTNAGIFAVDVGCYGQSYSRYHRAS